MTSDQLTAICRTPDAQSRFMTLSELLRQAEGPAITFYEATGRSFRVEVEMKGIKVQHGHEDDTNPLEIATAKAISRFRKSGFLVPIEIIMFHGTPQQVAHFSELRKKKTALGSMFTGLNFGERDDPDPITIDELRYGIRSHFQMPKIARRSPYSEPHPNYAQKEGAQTLLERRLSQFIVTLVHDQEFMPSAVAERFQHFEPSIGVDMGYGFRTQIEHTTGKRAERVATFDDAIMDAIAGWYSSLDRRNKRLHILTDYPAKARFIKDRVAGREIQGE